MKMSQNYIKFITIFLILCQIFIATSLNVDKKSAVASGKYVDNSGRYKDNSGKYVDNKGKYVDNSAKSKLDFSNFSSNQYQTTTEGKYIADLEKYVYKHDNRGKYVHVHIPYNGGYGPFKNPYEHDGRPYMHDDKDMCFCMCRNRQ
ncbi:uncharacterized protein [Chironomus tepperi]|uniref:uncharacterized protein isoform X3 n=1 Tax=Chironomus tepperi TaxID=113505 RepID=UPI00391F8B32